MSLSNRPFRAVGDDNDFVVVVARVVEDLRFSGRFCNRTADADGDGTVKEEDACSCVKISTVVGIIVIIVNRGAEADGRRG